MKTINAPAPFAARNNQAASFRISPRAYLSLGRFSNAADGLGVKTASIGKGPFNRGCLLKLSGTNDYEVLVDGTGSLLLGRVEKNGQRVRLAEGADTEASWEKL